MTLAQLSTNFLSFFLSIYDRITISVNFDKYILIKFFKVAMNFENILKIHKVS